MFDSLDACAEAWKRAGNHGEKTDRIARNLRWMRYYSYLNDPARKSEAEIDPHAAEVVELLFRQGLVTPESSVLDIGSGSGTYALAFAARLRGHSDGYGPKRAGNPSRARGAATPDAHHLPRADVGRCFAGEVLLLRFYLNVPRYLRL